MTTPPLPRQLSDALQHLAADRRHWGERIVAELEFAGAWGAAACGAACRWPATSPTDPGR